MQTHPILIRMASLIVLLAVLAGCATPTPLAVPTATLEPTQAPSPTPAPSPTAAPAVQIRYGGNAQTEIIAPDGTIVYIDIHNSKLASRKPEASDFLLTTHNHNDHFSRSFRQNFPGQQLDRKVGDLQQGDVHIYSLASAHDSNEIHPAAPDNVIFIIEVGGLRIGHFGDIGQDAFTPEQLEAIGELDVMITQLANSFSTMNRENEKGFNLIKEINPRLIIVAHTDADSAAYAAELWPGFFKEDPSITLTPDTLPAETTVLFLGSNYTEFGQDLALQPSGW